MADGTEEPPVDDAPRAPPAERQPVLIRRGPVPVKQVFAGADHTVFVDDGSVYAFGGNHCGQLGLGDRDDRRTPAFVRALSAARIVQAAAGETHTVFLDDRGQVYACGQGNAGQLGLGDCENRSVPTPVRALASVDVVRVAAGEAHTVALTDAGDVYVFGSNSRGQLGLAGRERAVPAPMRIAALDTLPHSIVQIAAGGRNTVLIDALGHVYTCGTNEVGQLGRGRYASGARRVTALAGARIADAAVGRHHIILRSDDGRVFAFGDSRYGQLGAGAIHFTPRPVPLPHRAAQVAAGGCHTLILTEEGAVYSCGAGAWGQLGRKGSRDRLSLVEHRAGEIVGCAAGSDHTALVAADGGVYTCGSGHKGQLGHGEISALWFPQKIGGL